MAWKLKMSSSIKLFTFFILYFGSLFLVFNVKSFLVVFLLAFIVLFFFFHYSLTHTVFILLLLSLPFENNLREWIFPVTPSLFPSVPTSGYELYFGISLKIIFGIFLFLLLLNRQKKSDPNFAADWSLLVLFLIAATLTLQHFSIIPLVGLLRLWLSLLFYFAAQIFFKKYPSIFPSFVLSLFIFATTIGLFQLIRQKPLGKFIELTPSYSQDFGHSTTDGSTQYRVSSFISHPVYFGSFFSILLPIVMALVISHTSIYPFILPLAGIMVLLGTHSRSVWLTILLSVSLLLPELKNKYYSFVRTRPYLVGIFIIPILIIISTRLPSVSQLLTTTGNASIRIDLAWQSLQIITHNPLGVGLNLFTQSLVALPIPSSLDGFIVPVHNTLLLIITELGIVSGALFIYFVLRTLTAKAPASLLRRGTIIGALTFLISSQFHPLLNLDPTFDLFMLTLGYLNSQCPPSAT